MLIYLAAFEHVQDRRPVQQCLPWPQVVARLLEHEERESKDGPLWSPTLYRKGVARGLAGVQGVTALVLDFDAGVAPESVTSAWASLEYVIHSTHSHSDEHPKWRAVFPLSTAVTAAEWPAAYRRLTAALGQGHPDPACKDASRIYYWPSCRPGAMRFAAHHPGAWLDLGQYPEPEPKPEAEKPARQRALVPAAPARQTNGRVEPEELIARALDRASAEGRNTAGLWLACQLRDNEYPREAAQTALERYVDRVPQGDHPYTLDEALHSLEQAFATPAREAWEQARPVELGSNGHTLARESSQALPDARAAVEGLREDPGAIFTEAALAALGTVRRWQPVEWARLLPLIRKHGLLRELERRLKEMEPEARADERPARLAGDMLDECPAPGLHIPSPYALSESATTRLVETENGATLVPIAHAPVLITGRARDTLTGHESVLLTWRWPQHSWRSKLVDRASAMMGRKLGELANIGFPYLEDQASQMVGYLSRLEAANMQALPCARISRHMGWQGDCEDSPFLLGTTLILPDGSIETTSPLDMERPETWRPNRVMFHSSDDGGEQQLVAAFRTGGTFREWAEAIALLAPFPRAMTAIYAGFCPPLLELFNVPNFVVDLSHSTGTGKSTSLQAAGSIWGNPDERSASSTVGTWDATRVGVERTSHVLSGLPLILDETKKAKSPQIVADMIYAIVSGRGRNRGTTQGLASTTYWRTVLLSTGEQPVTSFTQDGGTRTRVLAVRGTPLDRRGQDVGELAKRVRKQVCAHYGHAGLQFVQWLMRSREQWPEWRVRYDQWADYYSADPQTPEAGRLAQYAALVTIAAEMVHEALPLPWALQDPMQALWQDLAAEAADAAGEARAMRDVASWAHSREQTFWGRCPTDGAGKERASTVSGVWPAMADWTYIAFYPTVLRGVLDELGYEPQAILTGWRERGWLDCEKGRFTKVVRVDSMTPHMYVLLRKGIAAAEET